MKRMKYFLLLLMTLSLVLVTIPVSPINAAGTTKSIGAPTTVSEGETFFVNVNINGMTDLASKVESISNQGNNNSPDQNVESSPPEFLEGKSSKPKRGRVLFHS